MIRFLTLVAVVCFTAAIVFAVDPTGSAFPGNLDNFQAKNTGDNWTSTEQNRLLDAMNEVQSALFDAGLPRVACEAVSLTAAQRKLVNVSVSNLAGTEAVFGTAVDGTNPSRLEFDGVYSIAGNTVQVWVFNRDATNARNGSVCLQVSKTQ